MKNEFDINLIDGIAQKISGGVALAFSYQAEDAAALHLAISCNALRGRLSVLTLDTKRLFPETEAYHKECEKFFGIKIERFSAAPERIAKLEEALNGVAAIRDSVENRELCCRVRKIEPLRAALAGKSAWITGLRAAQADSRAGIGVLEWDGANSLIKINPLAAWTDAQLEEYISKHKIPQNPLYKKGFSSIGCEPCTRAIKQGEDKRAGRWWWENGSCKECGIHAREAAFANEAASVREAASANKAAKTGGLSVVNG